ncbi:hypothetical protein LCGC14_0424850 [marine sediment metagenome]|uniref:AraC-type arabinose-binding/dimerisation domain-containing protein n=1 Tax=marine sediment metagenome TaxID=412755 RepID=A0A0F9VZ73_9ZZZZ
MLKWIQKHLLGRSDIYFGESLYMRRWRFGPRKFFGVRLHHTMHGDLDRELHDHPFTFITIILSGGYWEHLLDGGKKWHGPGSVLLRQAEVFHRLELDEPTWTLVFRGPIRRMWGFLTDTGWISWKEHVARRESKAIKGTRSSTSFVSESSI